MNIDLPNVANVMIGLSAIVGLFAWRHLPIFARLIVVLQIFGCLTDILMSTVMKVWIVNVYLLIEVSLVLFAGYLVKPSKAKGIAVLGGYTIFVAIWIATLEERFFDDYQTNALVTGYVCIVGIFLWQLMQKLFEEQQDSRETLLCFCVLFYFSVVTPLYSFIDIIRTMDQEVRHTIHLITPIMNTTQSAVLSWVFLKYIKEPKLARE